MRLLLVDDEHHIVNYLSTLLEDYFNEDVEIYKCYSGIEALELLTNIKIDLMLLDIHMPGMSGLELAEKTVGNWPKCHIIFLTAHSNFDHIYQGLKYKNSKYLLKTESDEAILKTISDSLDAIKAKNEGLHILKEAKQKNILLSHLLQQNILKEFTMGHDITKLKPELMVTGPHFILDLNQAVYLMYMQIYHLTIDEYQTNMSAYFLQYLQLMDELLFERFDFTMLYLDKGTMLWFFQPKPICREVFSSNLTFLKTMTNDLTIYCESNLHRHVTLTLYEDSIPWTQICNIYHLMQRHQELHTATVPSSNSTVTILNSKNIQQEIYNNYLNDKSTIERLYQEFRLYLYQGDQASYYKTLKQFEKECISLHSMHEIKAIKIYKTLTLLLIEYIETYQLQEKLMFKISLYPLSSISEFTSWRSAFKYLGNLSQHLFILLDSKKLDKNEYIINKIKRYIDKHLSDSLTLSTLASIVNYNETYVSRLFKQITGMRISDYITHARITHAKQLLCSSDESIQAIAKATGFDTSQYFSMVFKKTLGVSPSEFRRLSGTN